MSFEKAPSTSRAWFKAAAFAAVMGTVTFSATSWAAPGHAGMHHGRHHGARMEKMDPAKLDQFLDRRIGRIVKDATPEQKARLKTIARAAFTDIKPLREQAHAAHKQMRTLLAQPNLDRVAIERASAEHAQLMERISRRRTAALVEAAEVLTPQQRAQVAQTRHGRKGPHRGEGRRERGQGPRPAA